MIQWLRRLLGLPGHARKLPGLCEVPTPAQRAKAAAKPPVAKPEPPDIPGRGRDEPIPRAEEFPHGVHGIGNLDRTEVEPLEEREHAILQRIGDRLHDGKLKLPLLPSTSMSILDLSANPSAQIPAVVETVERDPVLTTELLKTANSVMFAGARPAETLHQAVVRLGMRNLRSMILALSMKAVIFRNRGLSSYAEEVWRQALSMARIAKVLAPMIREEADRAFLIGLLHDIGKVPLLQLLGEEVTSRVEVSRSLVGKVFRQYHEVAGERMAKAWNLPEEVAAVAGCHHLYEENEIAPRGAALASLVHKIDLFLSLGSESGYWELRHADEMNLLELSFDHRREALKICLEAFLNKEISRVA